MDIGSDLREQNIITPENKVKDDIFIAGYRRIRIYTHLREYKYISSSDDEIARFFTLENSDRWQRHVLEVLEMFPDEGSQY